MAETKIVKLEKGKGQSFCYKFNDQWFVNSTKILINPNRGIGDIDCYISNPSNDTTYEKVEFKDITGNIIVELEIHNDLCVKLVPNQNPRMKATQEKYLKGGTRINLSPNKNF